MDAIYFLFSISFNFYFRDDSNYVVNSDYLSSYIEKFEKDGVVVIPNILSSDELHKVRKGLHNALLSHKIDLHIGGAIHLIR